MPDIVGDVTRLQALKQHLIRSHITLSKLNDRQNAVNVFHEREKITNLSILEISTSVGSVFSIYYIEKLHTVYPMLYKPTLKNSKN